MASVHRRATGRAVYAGYDVAEVRRAIRRKEEPSYQGTFTGARRYVLQTFATTESAAMKKRVSQYLVSGDCPECNGKRLRSEALSVTFAELDITELSRLPLKRLDACSRLSRTDTRRSRTHRRGTSEKSSSSSASSRTFAPVIAMMLDLALGTCRSSAARRRSRPASSSAFRLRQVRSNVSASCTSSTSRRPGSSRDTEPCCARSSD